LISFDGEDVVFVGEFGLNFSQFIGKDTYEGNLAAEFIGVWGINLHHNSL
jgi:hypothetical protein